MKVHEHFTDCSTQVKTRDFTCGVEFEIEDIKDFDGEKLRGSFIVENDDSLRNNGREFKTVPSSFEDTIKHFDTLFKAVKLGKEPFTDRTSTHVHVNVSNLSLVQARQLILTYALLEPVFFAWVGPERQNNIYCVPLNYTYLPNHYKNDAFGMHQKWHKYTAFNILPMSTLGTVEFRHLYGTGDKEKFTTWLTALKQLYTFIEQHEEFDVVAALGEMPPCHLAYSIVPVLAGMFTDSELNKMMEDTQLDVKLSVGGLK